MATEINGLLNVKDEAGNVNTIYPITKAENVEGLEEDCLKLSGGTMSGPISLPPNFKFYTDNGVLILADVGLPGSGGTYGIRIPNREASSKQVVIAGGKDAFINVGDKKVVLTASSNSFEFSSSVASFATLTSLQNIRNPSSNFDAANKIYVDVSIKSAIGDAIGGSY